MSYAAVCFDLDSTLCESIEDRETLLSSAFDRAGVEQFCGVAGLRRASREVEADTDREYLEGLFTVAADRAGADPTVAPTLADAYLETIDPSRVRFRPGAERALELARDRGPVALVTNGSKETQGKKLEALGVADAFDATVFVDPRNGVPPKPDPAPFERALSRLGVEPEASVHVGDNLYADVGGARGVGMDAAWLDLGLDERTGVDSDHDPTYELASLEEFERIL